MNLCIKSARDWLNKHPKMKEWVWFAALWFAGLFAVLAAAYPIKFLIRSVG